MPRRTLAEAFAQTRAVQAQRGESKRRISRAKREAVAPRPPAAAIMAYTNVMETYAERVEKLVERKLLSLLPVAGSGDDLDGWAMRLALHDLEQSLDSLALKVRRSALAAGKRVSQHGRSEVGRMMRVKMPIADLRTKTAIDAFAARNVALVQKAGRDQVARIRKAIAEHQEGESLRAKIKDALWVSRNRGKMIARDQAYKFHALTIAQWSREAGSVSFIWAAHKDERTRPGHARLDGQKFRWDSPPNTGKLEGVNLPGAAVNCRCRAVPVEALY